MPRNVYTPCLTMNIVEHLRNVDVALVNSFTCDQPYSLLLLAVRQLYIFRYYVLNQVANMATLLSLMVS